MFQSTRTRRDGLKWLITIRWLAALGQTIVFLFAVHVLGLTLEATTFVVVSLLLIASNAGLELLVRRHDSLPTWMRGTVMVVDIFLLTALLIAYGGHANPFSTLLLLQIMLAAMLLDSRWTWGLTTLATACYIALFRWHVPIPALSGGHHHHGGGEFDLHLQGMLVSFVILALLVSGAIQRMRAEIMSHESELERRRSNEQKLAAITTVAASVAHELGTPLGSMVFALEEIKDVSNSPSASPELRQPVEVLQSELARCTDALGRLSSSSGALFADTPRRASLGECVSEALNRFEKTTQARVRCSYDSAQRIALPIDGFVHVLHALVKNAIEASDEGTEVMVFLCVNGTDLSVVVSDHGCGFPAEILQRVGEPFFSTKAASRGMGLGLFVANLFIERYGGQLSIESRPNHGTTVSFYLRGVAISRASQ
jgi:two-component system sensor histidine kinase RegB